MSGKVAPLIKEYYPKYYSWNEYPVDECIPIRKVKEEWGILGNFAAAKLVVDDVEFKNSEQLFQIMKFSDRETILKIYSRNGLRLKWAAKSGEKNGKCRQDWGKIIIDCMKFCLQTKYEQNDDFRAALNETKGHYIVEDQTKNNTSKKTGKVKSADTWGVILEGENYVGSNLLGRLLMELRDKGHLTYNLPDGIFDFIKLLK